MVVIIVTTMDMILMVEPYLVILSIVLPVERSSLLIQLSMGTMQLQNQRMHGQMERFSPMAYGMNK